MVSKPNPFASPQAGGASRPEEGGETFAPCPRCGGTEGKRIGYTWWGGKLGPWLLKHVRCLNCGMKYNGRTGRSNLRGILLYNGVAAGVALIIVMALLLG